jgi:hypothetical protein
MDPMLLPPFPVSNNCKYSRMSNHSDWLSHGVRKW